MLRKALSLSDCQIKIDGESGRFSGYASVFGGVDSYGDTILKGAYDYTLRTNGKPKMFVQHDSMGLPIGKWLSAKEDDHGLFVEGELTPGMRASEDTRAALKHGTVDGLSIGYMLKKNDFEDMTDGRVIKRISNLVEVSIVTFPADSAARVDLTSVKSEEIEELETVRDVERLLRDVGAFDQVSAKRLITKFRELFAQRDVGDVVQAEDKLNRILSHSFLKEAK